MKNTLEMYSLRRHQQDSVMSSSPSTFCCCSYGVQFSQERRKVGEKYTGSGPDATSFLNSFEIARSWDLRSLVKLTK